MSDGDAEVDSGPEGVEAEYTLESPSLCPNCKREVATLHVVRLLRTRVHFVSTLPRRGNVLVCPHCSAILAADLRA